MVQSPPETLVEDNHLTGGNRSKSLVRRSKQKFFKMADFQCSSIHGNISSGGIFGQESRANKRQNCRRERKGNEREREKSSCETGSPFFSPFQNFCTLPASVTRGSCHHSCTHMGKVGRSGSKLEQFPRNYSAKLEPVPKFAPSGSARKTREH